MAWERLPASSARRCLGAPYLRFAHPAGSGVSAGSSKHQAGLSCPCEHRKTGWDTREGIRGFSIIRAIFAISNPPWLYKEGSPTALRDRVDQVVGGAGSERTAAPRRWPPYIRADPVFALAQVPEVALRVQEEVAGEVDELQVAVGLPAGDVEELGHALGRREDGAEVFGLAGQPQTRGLRKGSTRTPAAGSPPSAGVSPPPPGRPLSWPLPCHGRHHLAAVAHGLRLRPIRSVQQDLRAHGPDPRPRSEPVPPPPGRRG